MICHVCGEQAIGQCQSCGRFYCKHHGNIRCVACTDGIQESPNRVVSDWDITPAEAGGEPPVGTLQSASANGATCTWCRRTATGACTVCGMFYCNDHYGGKWRRSNQWSQMRQVLCHVCQGQAEAERRREWKFYIIAIAFGAVTILVSFILWSLGLVPRN
jgi:hypothetical protein